MAAQDLNYYSLLVPILMLVMGSVVLLYHTFKTLPKYLHYYAFAQLGFALTALLATIISGQVLLESSAYLYGLFFIACAINVYAIHQCFHLQTALSTFIVVIPSAISALFYFSIIDDQPNLRILIMGITVSLIYANQCITLFKKPHRHLVDYMLKVLLALLIILPTFRSLVLYFAFPSDVSITMQPLFWASTQLMLILISAAFLVLFISYNVQNSFTHLRRERNLDPLTGLQNRRAFNEQIQDIRNRPVTQNGLLICDLDHFKKINDEYGHHVGDLALKHVSRMMMSNLRQKDEISRFGGEEFIIILHDTQTQVGLQIAERIRKSIEINPLIYEGKPIYLTMSIGVSFFHFYSEFEAMLQVADQLLYQAKDAGRNQIQYQLLD